MGKKRAEGRERVEMMMERRWDDEGEEGEERGEG